jgi:hypothetical protein
MNESKMLLVTDVSDPIKDKNDMLYKKIQVSTPEKKRVKDVLTGEVKIVRSKVKVSSFNAYRKTYLSLYNIAEDKGCKIEDLKKVDIEKGTADFGYDAIKGESLEGEIITRRVSPYDIPFGNDGEFRVADFYTCPVLGSTEDEGFDQEIKVAFKRNGRILLSENWNTTVIKTEKQEEDAKLVFSE